MFGARKAIGAPAPGYGMLTEEKSSGDPHLDKVSVVMAEHNHARHIGKTMARADQMLESAGEVRLHLGFTISGPEMSPEELMAQMVERDDGLKAAIEGDDGEEMKQALRDHVEQLYASGQNRPEEHFQVDFPIPALTARQILSVASEHAPEPNPGKAAQALRDLADKVESQ